MNFKKFLTGLTIFGLASQVAYSQPQMNNSMQPGGVPVDSWRVEIRQMPPDVRAEITETMQRLNGTEEDRSIISEVGMAVGLGLVTGAVDVVVNETFNLIQYNKKQKQEWMRMIQNENNYTDSITSIKGLRDFYNSNSHRGALDPSDINFDGIEIHGMRNGNEVIYMSCSIDRDQLDHMFRHSKFNLVLDTLAFYPYQCHLPNVTANGIRTMNDINKGKAEVRGDTIIRPGSGGNGFSFDERNNLRVAIDFSILSSWINQAVQVHKDVELGKFNFTISVPDNVRTYTYSRRQIMDKVKALPVNSPERGALMSQLISVEGDCFVVPRSYMPLGNGRPMWGTGEYSIKVKIRESCQFALNSEKAKHWKDDYKRLRQMQNRSSEVQEYFQTLWNQYGNSMVKTSYSTALSTVAKNLTGQSAAGAAKKAAAPTPAQAPSGAAPVGSGQQPPK